MEGKSRISEVEFSDDGGNALESVVLCFVKVSKKANRMILSA